MSAVVILIAKLCLTIIGAGFVIKILLPDDLLGEISEATAILAFFVLVIDMLAMIWVLP